MSTCKTKLTLEEKELAILRDAVDVAEKRKGRQITRDPDVKKIITILEEFLKNKKLVCYGGTAINNILPLEDQFYDKNIEIPDYDFYSPNALNDAKELANIYYKEGFNEVEAKAGVHHGTYKVYVNFLPVADITYLEKPLFKKVQNQGIKVYGIIYCPPNFLRMNMYLELSRPAGDISRWEKVLKRLILLNKNFPLKGKHCDPKLFQREFEKEVGSEKETQLYYAVRDSFIDQGLVFFGGYASFLYSTYMPSKLRKLFRKSPDFDVLSEQPEQSAVMLKERLQDFDYKGVQIIKHSGIGELIAPHYSITVKIGKIEETVAFIYKPLACHSYNTIKKGNKTIKVATIDTMLSFYFAFFYSDREYYDDNRILCMAQYLFDVQQKNRLQQKGLLKRFSINCYGQQNTLEELREEKAKKYKELKNQRNSKEFESWFLRYVPFEDDMEKQDKKLKTENKKLKKQTQKRKPKREKTKKKKSRKILTDLFNII
jgi:hypothetical protein|uniref:Poly(A) polymerase catalytic subunit domain-containing protein n=1 Tax=viral metagenome TaxID=1070528 RepID=A0A6C0CIK7_9ZZZZ